MVPGAGRGQKMSREISAGSSAVFCINHINNSNTSAVIPSLKNFASIIVNPYLPDKSMILQLRIHISCQHLLGPHQHYLHNCRLSF